jgi:hypothetical protein
MNIKKISLSLGMSILSSLWILWLASSLGVPIVTLLYINKLDTMRGLSTFGNDDIMWIMLYGPFSIPISLLHAGSRTIDYLYP